MTGYFYVSKIGGGRPTYKHLSFEAAIKEAERLIDTIGGEYEILQARAVVRAAPKYVVTDLRITEFPSVMSAPYGARGCDDSMIPF
jgi:hypothetical protein